MHCSCHIGFWWPYLGAESRIPTITVTFALRTLSLYHHLISQEQKHLLLVLKIVMDLCREVRGEKDQREAWESVRVIKNSNSAVKLIKNLGCGMKAIFIFFLQHVLIRPDSPCGKLRQTLLVIYPNPFSLEPIPWWQSPRLKSICLPSWTLFSRKAILSSAQDGCILIRLSWVRLTTFFLPMTDLGKGIWPNSGHEIWGEACWRSFW